MLLGHQLIILQLLLIKVWFPSSLLSSVLTEGLGCALVIFMSPTQLLVYSRC